MIDVKYLSILRPKASCLASRPTSSTLLIEERICARVKDESVDDLTIPMIILSPLAGFSDVNRWIISSAAASCRIGLSIYIVNGRLLALFMIRILKAFKIITSKSFLTRQRRKERSVMPIIRLMSDHRNPARRCVIMTSLSISSCGLPIIAI